MNTVKESYSWIRLERSCLRHLEFLLSMIPVQGSFSREKEHQRSCWKMTVLLLSYSVFSVSFNDTITLPLPDISPQLKTSLHIPSFIHILIFESILYGVFGFSYTWHRSPFLMGTNAAIYLLGACLLKCLPSFC